MIDYARCHHHHRHHHKPQLIRTHERISKMKGESCKGFNRTAQQVGIRIFHVQRIIRIDCVSHATEQR